MGEISKSAGLSTELDVVGREREEVNVSLRLATWMAERIMVLLTEE